MKKLVIVLLFLVFQVSEASSFTSFQEAQKVALASNKMLIIDFTASWCGPCKKMDMDTWADDNVKLLLENFVFVKIDIDSNKELALKYNVKSIPNVYILDSNGIEVKSFLGYMGANKFINEIEGYAVSVEYLSSELINQYKFPCYINSIKTALKYYDFSLYLEDEIKSDFLSVSNQYLTQAKKYLNKSDVNLVQKKQKLELANLYYYAYIFNFEKLDKKLSVLKVEEIQEENLEFFWFLKYLVSKKINKEDFDLVDNNFKSLENFDYWSTKATLILSKSEGKQQ
jgi:thiol-disulfide isomerase/thioredoxin